MMMFMRMKLLVPQYLLMKMGESLGHNLSIKVLGIPLGTGNLKLDTIVNNFDFTSTIPL